MPVDVLDAVTALVRRPYQAGTQGSHSNVVLSAAHVPAPDAGVEGAELTHHPADDVRELVPGGDPVHQGKVFVPNPLPVVSVHARVVEVVPLQAPSVDEELPPVFPDVDGEGPTRQVHPEIVELTHPAGPGVDHVNVVGLPDEKLFPVHRHLESRDAFSHDGKLGFLFIVDR